LGVGLVLFRERERQADGQTGRMSRTRGETVLQALATVSLKEPAVPVLIGLLNKLCGRPPQYAPPPAS